MDKQISFISKFIELYRQHPCLWKVKDESYSNKAIKHKAYIELLEFYKQTVPSATIETVKKKNKQFKMCLPKEIRKVEASKSSFSADDLYRPSLWYYDLLEFLSDQKGERRTYSSDGSMSILKDEKDCSMEYNSFNQSESEMPSPTFPVVYWSDSIGSPPSNSCEKKRKPNYEQSLDEPIDSVLKTVKENDEFDGIGINVACKLRRMDEEQRLYAEMLIDNVLVHGLRGRLQEESDFDILKLARPDNSASR